jgi:hypothetical protein
MGSNIATFSANNNTSNGVGFGAIVGSRISNAGFPPGGGGAFTFSVSGPSGMAGQGAGATCGGIGGAVAVEFVG